MNKRPGLRKRLALELFRSIRKNRAKIHELRTLFWECTLRCNASCLHCGSDCHVSSEHPDMPVEDFLKVIDEITPHVDPHKVMITFTGGEALVRKDIEECGRELNRREYPWGIVSNGLLLNRARLDSLWQPECTPSPSASTGSKKLTTGSGETAGASKVLSTPSRCWRKRKKSPGMS